MTLPTVSKYAGPSSTLFESAGLTIWFSYATPIAFRVRGQPTVARENDWSNTTGKHLNAVLVMKEDRISGAEFEAQLAEITG